MSEDEEKLKKLKQSRGGHRAHTTKVMKLTETLMANGEMDAGNKALLLDIEADVLANKEILEEKSTLLKKLDEEVVELTTGDKEVEDEIVEAGDVYRQLKKARVVMERWLKKFGSEHCARKPEAKVEHSNSHKRLPKVELDPFDGDPLKFKSFWDMFESLVDKDGGLDDVTKFSHLKSKLKGKARLSVEGLHLTKENYENAKELLIERFGDSQVIIRANMDALLAIEPISSNLVTDLRDLYDIMEVHTRNLQMFDVCAKDYGPVLISLIMANVNLVLSRQMPQGK